MTNYNHIVNMRRSIVTFILLILLSVTISPSSYKMLDVTDSSMEIEGTYKQREEQKRQSLFKQHQNRVMIAIFTVESQNGNPLYMYNEVEDAVGRSQSRKIMVDEVNDLLGYRKYTYCDRWDDSLNVQIFVDYQNIVNPQWDAEMAARKWNGGREGDKKVSTVVYWDKVRAVLGSNLKL